LSGNSGMILEQSMIMRKRLFLLFIGVCLFPVISLAQKVSKKPAPNPKAVKSFNQAYIEFEKGNADKALGLLKKALKTDPKYANAWALQAAIYEGEKDSGASLKAYRMCIQSDPLYQGNYFYMAKYLFKLGRYDETLKILKDFENASSLEGFNSKKDAASEKMMKDALRLKTISEQARLDMQNMNNLDIRNLGPGINTKTYEYWPGMTIDGSTFIFTRLVDGQEDFYISALKDSVWSKAEMLPGKINTADNEGTTSVSADGRYIFYTVCNQAGGFGSCDIYYSYSNGTQWSQRFNLGKNVNGPTWDAQPALSADGRTLIFTSNRTDGFGGKDLWTTRFMNGQWSSPVNLGPNINTDGDDEAPFLHYDGKTLYFGSNGHPGYGDHDLFYSRLQPDGTWGKPENMGRGINTERDEVGMYVDYKGDKAYFASDRDGGFGGLDIYSFKIANDKKPGVVAYVKGNIIDAETKAELSGRIEVINLADGTRLLADSSAFFFTTLQPGGNYALNVYRKGYLMFSENFQPTQSSVDSPFLVIARLKPIKKEQTIVLRNIFFDVDKFELKTESFTELEGVLTLLKQNPALVIEIGGHTDNSGTAEHNQTLSENRAISVRNYLLSKGMPATQIKAKGYGSSKPMGGNSNSTEQEKASNRRIEMRVVSEVKP
jgi:outer membrane protein OmpA-like peptidoglycan-associated protein/tetratricopeptide (TPR) repeat protein